MKSKVRKSLSLLLAAVFICAGSLLVWRLLDARSAAQANDRALELANLPPESIPAAEGPLPSTPESVPEVSAGPAAEEEPLDIHTLRLLKWDPDSLQQVNPDVIGWILLPDTDINYPLLHTTDNSTYLNTAWDGTSSQSGSIFLETRSDPDLGDYNTIVYGHHMRNGSMFAPLMSYSDPAFLEAHPNVYIATGDGVRRYTVFAAYEASVVSDTYRLVFKNSAQKQTALDSYLDRSLWESPLTPTVSDRILTLSTCTGTGQYETRWVVQAVLTGFWAKEKAGFPQETSFINTVTSLQDP